MGEAALDAIGDPTRRRILLALADGERPVADIVVELARHAPISQPAVSQHLKVLRDAGLVTVRSAGTRRLHAVDPAGVAAAQAWLGSLLDPAGGFAQPLDALATEVARGRRAQRAQRAQRASRTSTSARSSAVSPQADAATLAAT